MKTIKESIRSIIIEELANLQEGKFTPVKGKVSEGPEELLGAYRRLVITSNKCELIKAEFNKFMSRPEIKNDYPVKMTILNSPKPNTMVVDVVGDRATTIAIKLGDIIKRTDSTATVLVRKEKKLR